MTDTHPTRLDRRALARAIEHLSADDLRWLNRLVVDRLKLIDQAHATASLARLGVGVRVRFTNSTGRRKTGQVIRLNTKTASILTDDSQRWNVSPHLLEAIESV